MIYTGYKKTIKIPGYAQLNKIIAFRFIDKPDEAFNITPLGTDMKAEAQIFYTRPKVKK